VAWYVPDLDLMQTCRRVGLGGKSLQASWKIEIEACAVLGGYVS
jgi:hypothetical protein